MKIKNVLQINKEILMVDVAPSILAADFSNLERDCRKVVSKEKPWLHFDVMDGVFVPNISVGLPVLKDLKSAIPEAWYDVHLMIQKPHLYVQKFIEAGADIVTFHFEAESPIAQTAQSIRKAGAKAGISICPKTPVEELFPILHEFDLVLIMSVEPGFGGQKFMPESLEKIKQLKKEIKRKNIQLVIEVDGGVDENTAPLCVEAGIDMLVAGSAIFNAQDPQKTLSTLAALEREATENK